ncbi:hypothetical protein [Herbiconiux sp. A18JL235]|uniref:TIGR03767 family metallophosphoesterase n=1 Tax=Herbiconiux sp. A18JL235 TaxID=3152363 RepID=A0AB39BHZ2_9MICO
MPGLSRRQFIAAVGALAAASAIPRELLGPALAGEASPFGAGVTAQHPLASAAVVDPAAAAATAPNTLQQTILQGAVQKGSYRTLVTGPGEPYLTRLDVLGRAPDAGRAAARRSLLYLGHLSDMHVIDAQSPGRIEPMIVQDHSAWGSAFHPQDPLSPHVTASTVKSISDLRFSPLTGAPMGAVIVTGDSADMHSHRELRWYIDLLDGLSVDPRTSSIFEGVQAWAEAVWAYRPGDPAGGSFGDYGFPTLPELLDQSIAQPVPSAGLPAPWYTVYGNHETLLLGTFGLDSQLRDLAVGGQKSYTLEGTASAAVAGYAAQTGAAQRALDALGLALGLRPGFKSVPADASRALFSQQEFMREHFETETAPGPVGHGFTDHNLASGETWWKADLSPTVRAFGLDTCNQVAGPDGAVPDDQLRWLRGELETATAENKLALVFSHHNSDTLENRAQRPGQHEVLHGAEVFVAMLLEFPVVVGWLNGHTHLNQILAHRAPGGGRVLGDHHRILHRLPAAAAGGGARRQPRRHALDIHHRGRPRGGCGSRRIGVVPRPGLPQSRARVERLGRDTAHAARLAARPQHRASAARAVRSRQHQRRAAGAAASGGAHAHPAARDAARPGGGALVSAGAAGVEVAGGAVAGGEVSGGAVAGGVAVSGAIVSGAIVCGAIVSGAVVRRAVVRRSVLGGAGVGGVARVAAAGAAGVLAVAALTGCSQLAALAPVGGDQLAEVRFAAVDVLLENDVDVLEAPVCSLDGTAISCTGSTVGGGAIEVTSSTSLSAELTVLVGGDQLFSGPLQSVLDKAARP